MHRCRTSPIGNPAAALLLWAFTLGACTQMPPYVVLTIQDPEGIATTCDAIAVGSEEAELQTTPLTSQPFPLSITVVAKTSGPRTLWVEARDESLDVVLGRARTEARFARSGTPTAVAVLARACTLDGDCFDDAFCDGTGLCREGSCIYEEQPCASNFSCVVSTCIEEAKQCSVTVNHAACADDEFCDPARGCVPGIACLDTADCDDGSTCNGAEQCIGFRCVSGSLPVVDDQDLCTIDGCNDANTPAVFHLPLSSLDGTECAVPSSGVRGVCVATKGGCALSECGDGVTDATGSPAEACDDGLSNSNDWHLDRHCNADCSAQAPTCGDGHVDAPHEDCDDGFAADTGNGCDATCRNNATCGDHAVQSYYEACDDGDTDNCNGCRNDCAQGCICAAPGACLGATWCNQGVCQECTTPEHCGPACVTCATSLPLCGGRTNGCICSTSPAPRGSCPRGSRCNGSTCSPCDSEAACGPECVVCGGTTPLCAGPQAGCVANSCAGQADFTRCNTVTSADRWYDICVAGTCVSPGCGTADCNAPTASIARADSEAAWRLPDSHQKRCTNATSYISCTSFPCNSSGGPSYCGQDAQYGWDTSHTDDTVRWQRDSGDEPVVLDLETSLVWQGCAAGLHGDACDQGVVAPLPWSDAISYCNNLWWAGHHDWRLPSREELDGTIHFGHADPAVAPTIFANTPSSRFWSISVSGNWPGQAFATDAMMGATESVNESDAAFVRCVRAGVVSTSTAARFVRTLPVANQPVVADLRTHLMWQGCLSGSSGTNCGTGTPTGMGWQTALSTCEALNWGGVTDWRMPSIRELQSLVNSRATSSPVLDTSAFPGSSSFSNCWSSTPYANDARVGWMVSFFEGAGSAFTINGSTAYLFCVRDMP